MSARVLWLGKLVVSAGLLVLVVRAVGLRPMAAALLDLDLPLAAAFLLALLFTCVKAWKWWRLLAVVRSCPFRDALRSYLAGLALGLLTPARLGEVSRAAFVPGQRRTDGVLLVLVDRAFEVVAVLVLALPGFACLAPRWGFAGAAGATLLLVGLLVSCRSRELGLRWLERVAPLPGGTCARLAGLGEALAAVPARVVVLLLLSNVVGYLLAILAFWLLLARHVSVGLEVALLTLPLVMLTNLIPVALGGLGVREGTAVLLLAPFGVPGAVATSAAFGLFVLNTGLPAIVGACLVPALRPEPMPRTD